MEFSANFEWMNELLSVHEGEFGGFVLGMWLLGFVG